MSRLSEEEFNDMVNLALDTRDFVWLKEIQEKQEKGLWETSPLAKPNPPKHDEDDETMEFWEFSEELLDEDDKLLRQSLYIDLSRAIEDTTGKGVDDVIGEVEEVLLAYKLRNIDYIEAFLENGEVGEELNSFILRYEG